MNQESEIDKSSLPESWSPQRPVRRAWQPHGINGWHAAAALIFFVTIVATLLGSGSYFFPGCVLTLGCGIMGQLEDIKRKL